MALPAGRYRITVRAPATRDSHSFVMSVPLVGGDYSFTVSATGNARYDFAFADARSRARGLRAAFSRARMRA